MSYTYFLAHMHICIWHMYYLLIWYFQIWNVYSFFDCNLIYVGVGFVGFGIFYFQLSNEKNVLYTFFSICSTVTNSFHIWNLRSVSCMTTMYSYFLHYTVRRRYCSDRTSFIMKYTIGKLGMSSFTFTLTIFH